MKFNKKGLLAVLMAVLLIMTLVGCSGNSEPEPIDEKQLSGDVVIFHAGSLSVPFDQIEKEFEALHPDVDVMREPAGSRECAKKITDLGKKADIMASADYTVIDNLLIPDYADWNALFAKNEMVIMYSEHSQFKDEINSDNWTEVLLKEGVQYGHSNPNADPCGYRALMVWQLAEKHYDMPGLYEKLDAARPERNIRPKETDLIAMIESGALDYLFIYRSVAEQHDMPYVELPAEVNLSDINHKDFYEEATVDTSGKAPGEVITQIGKPIVYGVTLVKNAENQENATEFMKFLLDKEQGLKILQECGQPIVEPLIIEGEELMLQDIKDSIN